MKVIILSTPFYSIPEYLNWGRNTSLLTPGFNLNINVSKKEEYRKPQGLVLFPLITQGVLPFIWQPLVVQIYPVMVSNPDCLQYLPNLQKLLKWGREITSERKNAKLKLQNDNCHNLLNETLLTQSET